MMWIFTQSLTPYHTHNLTAIKKCFLRAIVTAVEKQPLCVCVCVLNVFKSLSSSSSSSSFSTVELLKLLSN